MPLFRMSLLFIYKNNQPTSLWCLASVIAYAHLCSQSRSCGHCAGLAGGVFPFTSRAPGDHLALENLKSMFGIFEGLIRHYVITQS